MWLGPIQDPEFAERVLQSTAGQEAEYKTWPRIQGMVTLARDVSSSTPVNPGRRADAIGTERPVLLHPE
jgi:tRNA G26 N,N-dimethylase Trm1